MTVRVIVTDDSEVARIRLSEMISERPGFEVTGMAESAAKLHSLLGRGTACDVVLLDLHMAGGGGLIALRELTTRWPVVMISGCAPDSRLAKEALARGAADYLAKSQVMDGGAEFLTKALRRAAGVKGIVAHRVVLFIGSSGATRNLEALLPTIRDSNAAGVLLQHFPTDRIEALQKWIGSFGLRAHVARSGQKLAASELFIAPGDRHLALVSPGRLALESGPPIGGHQPSATRLVESAAFLGSRVLLVVLSGMGDDGAASVAGLIEAGGRCVVHEPAEASVPSMPKAALDAHPRVRAMSLRRLQRTIIRFARAR